MNLLYVCAAGGRRSAALAAYTNHFKRLYNLDFLEAGCAAGNEAEYRDHLERTNRHIKELAKAEIYEAHLEKLLTNGVDISPRIGVLLLEEGVEEILYQKRRLATPKLVQEQDLILAVTPHLSQNIKEIGDRRVLTVKEYLGYPKDDLSIPDVDSYEDRSVKGKMGRDRIKCNELQDFSHQILRKISEENIR
jgi:hypothetical protein